MNPISSLQTFWNQPNKKYRNFQIVYTFLTLNFFFPALFYAIQPTVAIQSFIDIGSLLSSMEYPLSEESYVWRVLAVGNVLTLAFCCAMLQLNIRRFYPILVPLTFLKGTAAFGYLMVFLWINPYPTFFWISLWDGLTIFLMLYFCIPARRSLSDPSQDPLLIPQPRFS